MSGHFAYYAVPTNSRALSAFRHYVTDLWRRTLRRRSQKDGFTWDRMTKLVADWLPPPRILHPWPDDRGDDEDLANAGHWHKGVYAFFVVSIICFTLGSGFVAYGLSRSQPTSNSSPFPSVIFLPAK